MTLEEDNDSLFPHRVTWRHRAPNEPRMTAMAILLAIRGRKDLYADMEAWLKEHDIVHIASFDQWKVSFVQLADAVQFHMTFAERVPSL